MICAHRGAELDAPPVLEVRFPAGKAPRVPEGAWTDRVVGIPGENLEKAALHLAFPSFTSSIVARGRIYRFTMVGSNPSVRNARKVTIPVQVIPVRFEFPDGTVLDPSTPNSGCAGSGTPLDLTLNSPHVRHLAELPELQGRDGALARDRRVVR